MKLTLKDFQDISDKTPVIADLKPSGKFTMSKLVEIGGIMPLMKRLYKAGLLHGDCLTVTGKTLAENLENVKDYPESQAIILPLDPPIKRSSLPSLSIWSLSLSLRHTISTARPIFWKGFRSGP